MSSTKVKRGSLTLDTEGQKPLYLKVTIGNANPGGVAVSWDGDIFTIPVGRFYKLESSSGRYGGSETVVSVLTRDVNGQTDNTSIAVEYRAGTNGPLESKKLAQSASQPGGEVLYVIALYAI